MLSPVPPASPIPWSQIKSQRGRKKFISTQGQACLNPDCDYYGCTDEHLHALVAYGTHGKTEPIQNFFCQACQRKFTSRRHTPLYRLKSSAKTVSLLLALLAEGVDVSALERVFGITEGTLRTWLTRAGMHSQRLHQHFFHHLVFHHLQLDELWSNTRRDAQELWVWVALDAKTKLIPAFILGQRTLDCAYRLVHNLHKTLSTTAPIPTFSTDDLPLYFYSLTAHFGAWQPVQGKRKPVWVVASDLLYAQLKKIQRRRKLVKVETRMLWGELSSFSARLKVIGFSGKINTAFVERVNLTLRQSISLLVRRTWSVPHYRQELALHLEWWRAYYHFVRPHHSLRIPLAAPAKRKGRQLPRRYRQVTPAMAAQLTRHRWTVSELLHFPLP